MANENGKAPAFQFYAQDFLTGVMYLTNEEKGMYITMLAKQWTDGRIPKKRLGLLVGIEWDKFSEELKGKFKDLGDHILNERLEKEREKKVKFLKKQVENGKKGGRPPKPTSSEPPENTDEEIPKKPKPFKNKNPNDNQKKPLEEEIEDEEEIENEEENVALPWPDEIFQDAWESWKDYKKTQFNFRYKTVSTEKAALTELIKCSGGDLNTALEIINKSIAQGWKGFFELQKVKNGKDISQELKRAAIALKD